MANYNLATIASSATGSNYASYGANTGFTLLTHTLDNSIVRVNSLILCNDSSTLPARASVSFYTSETGNTYYLAYNHIIPFKGSVNIISRDTAIYMRYNDNISVALGDNYNFQLGINIIVNYDLIY